MAHHCNQCKGPVEGGLTDAEVMKCQLCSNFHLWVHSCQAILKMLQPHARELRFTSCDAGGGGNAQMLQNKVQQIIQMNQLQGFYPPGSQQFNNMLNKVARVDFK